MAFIAGAVIGCLIGAALVYAYEIRWMQTQEKKIDNLRTIVDTTCAFQQGVINELEHKLKMYITRYGPLPNVKSTNEEN